MTQIKKTTSSETVPKKFDINDMLKKFAEIYTVSAKSMLTDTADVSEKIKSIRKNGLKHTQKNKTSF